MQSKKIDEYANKKAVDWYKKLSTKLQKISTGQMTLEDYYFEVQDKIKTMSQQEDV